MDVLDVCLVDGDGDANVDVLSLCSALLSVVFCSEAVLDRFLVIDAEKVRTDV